MFEGAAVGENVRVITGKDGKVRSRPTNLANSKYTVYLHMESKGKVPISMPQFAALMKTGTSTMTITFIFGRNVQPSELQ